MPSRRLADAGHLAPAVGGPSAQRLPRQQFLLARHEFDRRGQELEFKFGHRCGLCSPGLAARASTPGRRPVFGGSGLDGVFKRTSVSAYSSEALSAGVPVIPSSTAATSVGVSTTGTHSPATNATASPPTPTHRTSQPRPRRRRRLGRRRMIGQNVRSWSLGPARVSDPRGRAKRRGIARAADASRGISGAPPLARPAFLSGHSRRVIPPQGEVTPAQRRPSPRFSSRPPVFVTVPRPCATDPARGSAIISQGPTSLRKGHSLERKSDLPRRAETLRQQKSDSPLRGDSRPSVLFDDPSTTSSRRPQKSVSPAHEAVSFPQIGVQKAEGRPPRAE